LKDYDETQYLDLASEDLNGVLSESFFEFIMVVNLVWIDLSMQAKLLPMSGSTTSN
jgi:hypothetical protein